MADLLKEHKDALVATALNQVERALAQRGLQYGPRGLGMGNPLGAGAAETSGEVATGYDGSETVALFMLDLSLLDGPDVLAGP